MNVRARGGNIIHPLLIRCIKLRPLSRKFPRIKVATRGGTFLRFAFSYFRSSPPRPLLLIFSVDTSYKVCVRNFDNFAGDQEYRSCAAIIYFSASC